MEATDVEALRKRLEEYRTHEGMARPASAVFKLALRWLDELKIPDAAVVTREHIRKICFKAIGGWECEECKGDYCPFGGGKEANAE